RRSGRHIASHRSVRKEIQGYASAKACCRSAGSVPSEKAGSGPAPGTWRSASSFSNSVSFVFLRSSFAEISADRLHLFHRIRAKGAALRAMPAMDTIRRFPLQMMIMICGQSIAQLGQIIVFMDQRDVQSRRAWMTVTAVYAAAFLLD